MMSQGRVRGNRGGNLQLVSLGSAPQQGLDHGAVDTLILVFVRWLVLPRQPFAWRGEERHVVTELVLRTIPWHTVVLLIIL